MNIQRKPEYESQLTKVDRLVANVALPHEHTFCMLMGANQPHQEGIFFVVISFFLQPPWIVSTTFVYGSDQYPVLLTVIHIQAFRE